MRCKGLFGVSDTKVHVLKYPRCDKRVSLTYSDSFGAYVLVPSEALVQLGRHAALGAYREPWTPSPGGLSQLRWLILVMWGADGGDVSHNGAWEIKSYPTTLCVVVMPSVPAFCLSVPPPLPCAPIYCKHIVCVHMRPCEGGVAELCV